MEFDVISYVIGLKSGGGGGSSITVEPITLTENGNYTAPTGKAYSPVYVRIPEEEQATPVITVDTETGEITATATQSEGLVAAGTKEATQHLPTQSAHTFTPGTTDQTVPAGKFLTGEQTIKGDANLSATNIAAGVNIFGVNGTYTSDADAVAANIMAGKTAYVGGVKVTGTAQVSVEGTKMIMPEGLVTIHG